MAPRTETTALSRSAIARVIRRATALGALVAMALAAPASALQLSPPSPHSPNTDDMTTAYWVMFAITLIVLVGINAALVMGVVRFRSRRGTKPTRITAARGAIRRAAAGFTLLAVAVFVFGIVLADSARTVAEPGPNSLTAFSSRSAQVPVKGVTADQLQAADEALLSEDPEGGTAPIFKPEQGDPLVIDAIAQQWVWRFQYPGGVPGQRTFSYGELVVPVDTPVVLEIDSTDVIHSWWVPALTGQVQAVPGSIARTWFMADETGVYTGQGTVFDGTSYPSLTARVRVVDAIEYEAFVEGLAGDLTEAQDVVAAEAEAASASAEETSNPAQEEGAASAGTQLEAGEEETP